MPPKRLKATYSATKNGKSRGAALRDHTGSVCNFAALPRERAMVLLGGEGGGRGGV